MPTEKLTSPSFPPARRRLLQWMAQTALFAAAPAWAARSASTDSALWPQDSRVPGGVARLSLGPASARPLVTAAEADKQSREARPSGSQTLQPWARLITPGIGW
jgi:hypothetical protein